MSSTVKNLILYVPRRIWRAMRYVNKQFQLRRAKRLSTAEVFTELYKTRAWAAQPWVESQPWAESVSGPGSSLKATEPLRAALPGLLTTYNIRSMLDVPCGDFNWMQHVDLSNIRYTGGDIVGDLVQEVAAKFARAGSPDGAGLREFRVLDLLTDDLPKADLVLCRDCLFHLSNAQIHAALANIRRSGATYLLATTFWRGVTRNEDIVHGEFRPLDLERAPFRFPKPLLLVDEPGLYPDRPNVERGVALWRVSDLPA